MYDRPIDAYYKIKSICTVSTPTDAVFIDPEDLTTMRIPITVWASVDWYTKSDQFCYSEVVGLSALEQNLSLCMHETWKDNFVCYCSTDDEPMLSALGEVTERIRKLKEACGDEPTQD